MLSLASPHLLARSGEAEEVGPERTERGFFPGLVSLDCREAAKLAGVR